MNAYQKQVIIDNMHWLCENTIDEASLSEWLSSEGVLTDTESNAIVSRRSRYEKTYALYNHLVSVKKPNTFFSLLNSLKKTNNDRIAHYLELQYKEKLTFKKKMVGISLEKFLIPHLTMLCEETINSQNIARELMSNGFIEETDINTVLEHPDKFCKNAELYKIIQFKCNYEQMMRILRDTGNEKIANRLDDMVV